jgi:DNA-binding transcriptional LysR family regulator
MLEQPSSRGTELPHLGTFAKAAERGSFTAAAVELGLTQAAVSQRIALLERELRVSLFDRKAGRICLTAAGQELYAYARRILELHAEAREVMGGLHVPVSGELPIGASSVPAECYLPALLSTFHEEYPHVHVRAFVGDSSSVVKDVEKGQVSLGLVGQRFDAPSMEYRSVGGDCLVLVVPLGHRWTASKSIAIDSLRDEPLILREPGSGSRFVLERALERSGMDMAALNVMLELGSNAAIKDAVRGGLAVAFLSYLAVRRELEAEELLRVEVEGLSLNREFYSVYDRRRPLTPAAGVFMHFLESHPLPAECC